MHRQRGGSCFHFAQSPLRAHNVEYVFIAMESTVIIVSRPCMHIVFADYGHVANDGTQ